MVAQLFMRNFLIRTIIIMKVIFSNKNQNELDSTINDAPMELSLLHC